MSKCAINYRAIQSVFGLLLFSQCCYAFAGFQQDSTGLVVAEAENFHTNTPQNNHNWLSVSLSGFSGTGAMQALPNDGTRLKTNYVGNSPRLDFHIDFITSGLHYVWVRGAGYGGGSNSVHAGLDNQEVPSSANISFSKNKTYLLKIPKKRKDKSKQDDRSLSHSWEYSHPHRWIFLPYTLTCTLVVPRRQRRRHKSGHYRKSKR